jgi:hypothetical protein
MWRIFLCSVGNSCSSWAHLMAILERQVALGGVLVAGVEAGGVPRERLLGAVGGGEGRRQRGGLADELGLEGRQLSAELVVVLV